MTFLSLVLLVGCGKTNAQGNGTPWAEVFADGLEDAGGKAVALDQLKGKIIGVYFSAHWCPPCRAFSPKLVSFRDKNAEHFEVVFVSSDRSAAGKKKYMEELKMAWPSVPFRAASGKKLADKHKVNSLPTLLIFGPDGKLLTRDGRSAVQGAPDQALAKWRGLK